MHSFHWLRWTSLLTIISGLCIAGLSRAEGRSAELDKDVARMSNGKALLLSWQGAYEYCLHQNPKSKQYEVSTALGENRHRHKGVYLPFARQFAEESRRLGAQGLLETTHQGSTIYEDETLAEVAELKEKGYYAVLTRNRGGQPMIDFYFNPQGYNSQILPDGNPDYNDYWVYSGTQLPKEVFPTPRNAWT